MEIQSMPADGPAFHDIVAGKIGLEKIKPCYACGSCTGVCPVREIVEDFDPRRMIHMVLLGLKEELLSSDLIWYCCFCNSCFFVCPQGIRFSRIAKELQQMALDGGYVPEGFLGHLREQVDPLLNDLCRRTLFRKVREGFHGPHKMPCWRKHTATKG